MLFLVTHENTVNQSYCLLPGKLLYVLVTFIEQNFLWGGDYWKNFPIKLKFSRAGEMTHQLRSLSQGPEFELPKLMPGRYGGLLVIPVLVSLR